MRIGLLKSIDTESAMPHGRKVSATRVSCGMNASVITCAFALTLLIVSPLMPTEASSRA